MRAALVLYSSPSATGNRGIHVLLGKGAHGLTTLGGRVQPRETWIDCLVRELIEETRGILDYSNCRDMLLVSPTRIIEFDNCAYVFCPTTLETLGNIAKQFPETKSPHVVCNEMSSLEVVSIDNLMESLIESLITSRADRPTCAKKFESMFLTIGFDLMRGNTWNHITMNINEEVTMFKSVSSLPPVVCLTAIDRGLPVVYGFIEKHGLFITDQCYFERKNRRLYRSGWHNIG